MRLSGTARSRIHAGMQTEGDVVRLQAEGQSWASFDAFFEAEHERLFKALYFVTGNLHDAEELMQDAFLTMWERWGDLGRIDDVTGYLFRVALNGSRMRWRRAEMAKRKLALVGRPVDPFADAEVRVDVQAMLQRLTPRQRAALLLTELMGYPSDEAASIMGVRASTVRALATQGRQAMRATRGDDDA
ncbi:MAG TPA: sigma-70 family RNA polymerase sigma factor [Actinomycetota bacterium]